MPSVKVRENEPFEFALRRFKRTCEKAGVIAETRKREFYEKPTQERKRKAAAAVKRQARRSSRDVTKRQRLYRMTTAKPKRQFLKIKKNSYQVSAPLLSMSGHSSLTYSINCASALVKLPKFIAV